MELHSYAKLRASKKWNIEQKRKLVEARISYDSWFNSKPSNSVVPWKKVLSVAKLDDFNVFFVRKQWSNMLTKYKLYKQTRLDGIGGINKSSDIIQRINQEWEFFEPIHTFMTRKTTNLHSYAVTQKFLNNTITTTMNSSLIEANNDNSNSNGMAINNTIANINEATHMILGDNVKDELTATSTMSSVFTLSRTALGDSERKTQQQQQQQIVVVKNENRMDAANVKLERDCIKENIPNNNNMTILLQVAADGTAVPKLEDIQQEQQNYHPHHHHHMFSSDTNEEFEVICETDITNDIMLGCQHHSRNTDHDCYSKHMAAEAAAAAAASVCKFPLEKHEGLEEEEQRQLHYFADTSEESMGTEYVYQTTTTTSSSSSSSVSTTTATSQNVSLPSVMENIELHTEDGRTFEIKTENISTFQNVVPTTSNGGGKQEGILLKDIRTKQDNKSKMPETSSQAMTNTTTTTTHLNKMSERDKYYRHKRRFNRRLEKRFDAILEVMGQVVKSQYPTVDIQPLMAVINSTTTTGLSGLLNTSSDEDSEEDNDGKKNQT